MAGAPETAAAVGLHPLRIGKDKREKFVARDHTRHGGKAFASVAHHGGPGGSPQHMAGPPCPAAPQQLTGEHIRVLIQGAQAGANADINAAAG